MDVDLVLTNAETRSTDTNGVRSVGNTTGRYRVYPGSEGKDVGSILLVLVLRNAHIPSLFNRSSTVK